ncbi:unnamed protein product [Clonostachys chloroleuca]|uniref:TauD/TfdA-like domain-containing protein n=1 Tax=Clonostachys chloroleuca TaxID=1926264 RepID=A0AA35M4W5_9HYPO|nr:unnamed protein product [Clonostachys chloroleuca]
MQPINESTDQLQGLPTLTPLRAPLKYCGSLDEYMRFDVTPVIGTEFRDLQLADILSEDRKLRDLAILGKLQIFTGARWLTRILVSERGVIFFRTQKITIDQQKFLATKLGELSGKPTTSKVCSFIHVSCTELSIQLHKHILHNKNAGISVDGGGRFDDEVSVISSEVLSSCFFMSYERVPSDYAILQITTRPEDGSGGDTLWASGYEVYDRLSPPMRHLLDGLKTFHDSADLAKIAASNGTELTTDRGAPENSGLDFQATHPVVRTNPVTGWRSVFGAGPSARRGYIQGVSKHESRLLTQYIQQLVSENHDLQVRFTWRENDVAIWDNDFVGKRRGNRVVSLGEIPYFDHASMSQMASLTDGVQPSTLDEKVLVQDSSSQNLRCHPLKYSGSLDQYYSFQHTPAIGTEFPDLQVSNLLNKDEALRDLAILKHYYFVRTNGNIKASQRGVVFFRNQKLDPDQLKLLAGKLGELTGKPSTSKLHRHALIESQKALATEVNGKFDDEVWVISSHVMRNHFPARFNSLRPLASDEWHTEQVSCIAYENIPADYTVLHMMQNPEDGSGGDTLWASGYEAYNRLSPHFRKMVDEMTVTTSQVVIFPPQLWQ